MAGNQQYHRPHVDHRREQTERDSDARSATGEPRRDGAVDRVVTDVKDGVDLVAEKIKDLLRSSR